MWTLYYDRYMPIIGTGVPERNPRHISILKCQMSRTNMVNMKQYRENLSFLSSLTT